MGLKFHLKAETDKGSFLNFFRGQFPADIFQVKIFFLNKNKKSLSIIVSPGPCFVLLKSDFENGIFCKNIDSSFQLCHFSLHFYMNVYSASVVLQGIIIFKHFFFFVMEAKLSLRISRRLI